MITTMNQNYTIDSKDRQVLEKYIRFFSLKTIQCVVQSRMCLNKRSCSKVNPSAYDWVSVTADKCMCNGAWPEGLMLRPQNPIHSGKSIQEESCKNKRNIVRRESSYFNVAIEDEPSIQEIGKKALASQPLFPDFCLCIEIQLKTADTNDILILETWALCIKEQCDTHVSVSSVYPRMSLLLKSIIAVSRVSPAYKLSSRQSPDSYTILYRIYFGPPQVRVLGEGYQENKIGEVVTPLGKLVMTLAYRTKMTITPQKVEKESPFMVKSDYFKPDMSPKRLQPGNGFYMDYNHCDESGQPLFGKRTNSASSPNGYRKNYPFSFMSSDKDVWNSDKRNSSINPEDCRIAGAFAPSSKFPDPSSFPDLILPDKPILNLISSSRMKTSEEQRQQSSEPIVNGDKNANLNDGQFDNEKDGDVDFNCNANERTTSGKMTCSGNSECGDFVMVELRPPFARSSSNNDLGAFFRECQCAPPLASFATQPTLEEQVSDIASQLAKFEVSLPDFDSFVDGMCKADASK